MPIQDNTVIWKIKKISNAFNIGADAVSFEALRLSLEERFNMLVEQTNTLVDELVAAKMAALPPAVYVATCDTALKTTAKVATITNADNFILKAGVSVLVEFTDSPTKNTLNSYLGTLNVNNTGDITIKKFSGSSTSMSASVHSNKIMFVYDGVNWVLVSAVLNIVDTSSGG